MGMNKEIPYPSGINLEDKSKEIKETNVAKLKRFQNIKWPECPKGVLKVKPLTSQVKKKVYSNLQTEKIKYRERSKNQTGIRLFICNNKYRKIKV